MVLSIPLQLQKNDFRFCLVSKNGKNPIEQNWQKDTNYEFGNNILERHLQKNGNYGVVTGNGGLLVLDFDDHEFYNKISILLPATFTVRSGSGMFHKYFICDDPFNASINSVNGKHLADIQGPAKQVVGAGSTHPNGVVYSVFNDIAIANISREQIEYLFFGYLKKLEKLNVVSRQRDNIVEKIKEGFGIVDLLKKYGHDTHRNPTQCAIEHSCKGHACLSFDETNNIFYCFSHQCGGDIFSLVMKHEKCNFMEAKNKLCQLAGIKLGAKPKIKFQYRTEHLNNFDNFFRSTLLQGHDYKPIIKGVYYFLISRIVTDCTKNLLQGCLRTDPRIHLLVVLPSGGGKKNIKNSIQKVFETIPYKGHAPTSLNPEQLIGKVINRGRPTKPNWIQNEGYFSRDYIIFDEMGMLLMNKDNNIQDSRKNLRISKDPIGQNRIEKKSVDNTFDEGERISYCPEVVVCGFIQPKHLPPEIIEDGDLRRDFVLYKKGIADRNKTDEYKNRLMEQIDVQDQISIFSNFCKNVKQHITGKTFAMTKEAVDTFAFLHNDLIKYGQSHSPKGRNFTKMIDYFLQDLLMKIAVVIAATRGVTQITVDIVKLAYVDLFELFDMQLNFVNDKIIGSLDYGERWSGAKGNDEKALDWLHQNEADDLENTKISVDDYKQKICEIFNVKERMAVEKLSTQIKNGWVETKQGFQVSKVWLKINPAINDCNDCYESMIYQQIIAEYDDILRKLPTLHSLQPFNGFVDPNKSNTDWKGDVNAFLDNFPKGNTILFESRFGEKFTQQLLSDGWIVEIPAGTYRWVNVPAGGSVLC